MKRTLRVCNEKSSVWKPLSGVTHSGWSFSLSPDLLPYGICHLDLKLVQHGLDISILRKVL